VFCNEFLIPSTSEQLELFASPTHAVSEASDKINDRWGEFVITPALMMGMDDIILDRISFGGCAEFGYCAVCNGLGRHRGYVHAENRAKVRGHLAIAQFCHEAGDVTLTARDLVLWPVQNSW
jgi:hypothetical protein